MARHGIDKTRVTMTYYEAGHMMYLHDPSREAVAADIRSFIAGR
jgi:carboxypeptidase C (cathepsin A)